MTPEQIEDQRRYLERGAIQSRERLLRHMRSMVSLLEKADKVAHDFPAQTLYHHEDMQNAILWNVWNCGLVELYNVYGYFEGPKKPT